MSKIYERCLHNSLSFYAETMLPSFISTHKKSCSSYRVLLRRTENWKKLRDNKSFVGTVLMDLSKAFDRIPHDLLASELFFLVYHAYGLSK